MLFAEPVKRTVRRPEALAAIARAAKPVVEQLENRTLLSASLPVVTMPDVDPMTVALRRHELTPAQMADLGVASVQWNGRAAYAKAGEWIVKLDRGGLEPIRYTKEGTPIFNPNARGTTAATSSQAHRAFFENRGGGITFERYLGGEDILLVKAPAAMGLEQVQAALRPLDGVVAVEPNVYGSVTDVTIPNDQYFTNQYALQQSNDIDIDAPEAWDRTTGWSGAVIGVIDSGVDYTHIELDGNMWVNSGEIPNNGIDEDGNGYTDDYYGYDFTGANDSNPADEYGHGTHVAGIIAAEGNNGVGTTGVMWDASIMAIKWVDAGGNGAIGDAIEAVRYSRVMRNRGVNMRVTNNSWHNPEGYSSIMESELSQAGTSGMLFVFAAGNGGSDRIGDNNDQFPVYPASYALDNIISVAATDSADARASFSNYGATSVDLGAPGVDILSTYPNNQLVLMSGTSQAAPHVTGAVALALTVRPEESHTAIKNAILSGVNTVSSLNGITVTGGRLNANLALQQLAPATVTLNGDLTGIPVSDNILVRRDPLDTSYYEGLVNGTRQFRVLASGVTSIAVNGLEQSDVITVDAAVSVAVFISGGGGNDSLYGGSGADWIWGGSGNDTIYGGASNDHLYAQGGMNQALVGDDGDDWLVGDTGNDLFRGGNGNDTVDYSGRTQALTLDLSDTNGGTDGAAGEGDNIEGSVENAIGGEGNDTIYGNDNANTLNGAGGNDVIFGRGGNDVINGGAGLNSLVGDDGDDWFMADNTGNDLFRGGNGKDTVDYSRRTQNLQVSLDNAGNDGSPALGEADNVEDSVEDIITGDGNDVVWGSTFNNTINTNGGADMVWARAGNDTINGGSGQDQIWGEDGTDLFYALDGFVDNIDGGAGTDTVASADANDVLTNI